MTKDQRIRRIQRYLTGCQDDPFTGTRDLDYAEHITACFRWNGQDYRILAVIVGPTCGLVWEAVLQDSEGDTDAHAHFSEGILSRLTDAELEAIESLCEYAQDRALSEWERRREDYHATILRTTGSDSS